MEKQKLDVIRGSTYQSGEALKDLVPTAVLKKETEKKQRLKVDCGLFGCYVKGHKRITSKKCKYHNMKNEDDLHKAVDEEMRLIYPEEYGEFCYSSTIASMRIRERFCFVYFGFVLFLFFLLF